MRAYSDACIFYKPLKLSRNSFSWVEFVQIPKFGFRTMTRQQLIRDQADQANEEAVRGGIDGGIRWFLGGVIVFGTAQLVWPLYRGLTPQFKVGPRLQCLMKAISVIFRLVFWRAD
jgi:hypothetical protein